MEEKIQNEGKDSSLSFLAENIKNEPNHTMAAMADLFSSRGEI